MNKYKVYLCDISQRPGDRMKRLPRDVTMPRTTSLDFLEEAWHILPHPARKDLKVFGNQEKTMVTVAEQDNTPVLEFVRYA